MPEPLPRRAMEHYPCAEHNRFPLAARRIDVCLCRHLLGEPPVVGSSPAADEVVLRVHHLIHDDEGMLAPGAAFRPDGDEEISPPVELDDAPLLEESVDYVIALLPALREPVNLADSEEIPLVKLKPRNDFDFLLREGFHV